MIQKLQKLLSKLGLSESERSLILRAALISTGVCALLIAAFWGVYFFTMRPADPIDKHLQGLDAAITAPEIGDLDIEAHDFTARRYMLSGRPDAALPHLQRIAALRKGEPAAFYALERMVSAYLELNDPQKALETIDNMLIAYSDYDMSEFEASLQVRRGIALYYLKEFEESSDILQNALANDPRNAEALCFMGQMEAAAQTRSPTAERFFRRAIEADPNYAEARYQFARYFENNGDYESARDFLLQTLEKDPLNVRAHARLGMVYYYMKDTDLALKSYQTALALNPQDYNTRYNLGELYRTFFEDNENALKEFVKAIDINPKHADANYRAGLICAGNNMMKEAIRYFETSLQNDRQNVRRLLQLAAAYERIGDKENALAVYREIKDADPLNSIALQKIRLLEMEN